MAINWQDVITTIGGVGVVSSAVAWMLKTVVTAALVRDTKRFETRLKADADVEIERLKNSLRILAVEHQVRYSKLHEKRAEVIADTYRRMVEASWACERYILQMSIEEAPAHFVATDDKVLDFWRFVEINRIYLPHCVCTLLDNYSNSLRQPTIKVFVHGKVDRDPQTVKERKAAIGAVYKAFERDIPVARQALEEEFRSML
jgi:hypothetical protein